MANQRVLFLIGWLLLPNWVYSASQEMAYGQQGMVATRSAAASKVGAAILARGGNAIDAAVAVGFALAVTYPSAGNLGGGGFMVIMLADGRVETNDHREKAPLSAGRDMFLDAAGNPVPGLSTHSHLAVGVPGSVAGMLDVLERHGTLDRQAVIAPAIRLAKKGFPINHDLARDLNRRQQSFSQYSASLAIFGNDGEPWKAGDRLVQRDLARTLKRISREGRAGFYKGKTAELIAADMQKNGGLITQDDLANYQSVWREPIRIRYRDNTIYSMPPPSSGGVLLAEMLNMLEPFDIAGMGYGSAASVHHLVEVERRAYADRAQYLGDTDFFPTPISTLTAKTYAQKRFADFNPQKASRSEEITAGTIPDESLETTHVSIMDSSGNAVAYTTTLNLSYGSKIVAPGTGVLLNNEMDDFSVKENTPNFYGLLGRAANAIEPEKRMLSSMTPTIVAKDGKPLLVTGSPGGSTIITTTLQVIINVLDHGMDLSDAVGKPRFHHQWQPDQIVYERFGLSPDTLDQLRRWGHKKFTLMPYGRGIGDANSVLRVGEVLQGMADPRNSGQAIGVP